MKITLRQTIILAASLSAAEGFTSYSAPRIGRTFTTPSLAGQRHESISAPLSYRQNAVLNASSGNDSEIERLRAQAAALRAEAAKLESEKAQSLALAAERAFNSFDTNNDGEVSVSELKAGLEKTFKLELSEKRVKELMQAFDKSGDNALQLEEFVTLDRFKNKLNELVRDEKDLAKKAQQEAESEANAAKLAQARLELLNDNPPTNNDKFLSLLPYLFPLMDGLQYGRFLLSNADGSNPFVAVLAVLYALYRSIPFSGFVAFFALNFLSSNPQINRLVRFNMQQAIFLDIALFVPGLLIGINNAVLPALGVEIPKSFTEISSDVVFFSLLATLAYCTISSVLGSDPDKIPVVSQAVKDRMPTLDMFDDEGRFVGRRMEEDKKDDDKDSKK